MTTKLVSTLLFFTLCIHYSFAQNLNGFKKPSAKHVQIKGTNVFIIPPMNFVASDRFKGFQNPNDKLSMIMLGEMLVPFSEFSKGFTSASENDNKQGMNIINKSKVKVNNYEGLFIELGQDAYEKSNYSKSILIYGNEDFTTIINGVFVKDSVEIGKSITESILSTVVNSEVKVDPRDPFDFEVEESKGDLVFNGVMGKNMLFNRDGKFPTQSSDMINLILVKGLTKIEIKNKKKFCMATLKKFPEKFEIIGKRARKIKLSGLKGYRFFAKSLETKNEEMYHVILFGEGREYYRLMGTYNKKKKKAKTDVINVINTFKLKK